MKADLKFEVQSARRLGGKVWCSLEANHHRMKWTLAASTMTVGRNEKMYTRTYTCKLWETERRGTKSQFHSPAPLRRWNFIRQGYN